MLPLFAWGLDEAVECVGFVMAAIFGLLFLLYTMERSLNAPKRPSSAGGGAATSERPEGTERARGGGGSL